METVKRKAVVLTRFAGLSVKEILDQKCEIEFDCALRAEVIDTFIGERLCCILAHAAFSFRVPTDKTLSRFCANH
jgi:hypothetical protein